MNQKGSRWTARDWADALVAHDQLQWMSNNDQARTAVNDSFLLDRYDSKTPLEWGIRAGVESEKLRFLVEQVGAKVTDEALSCAVYEERWDLADYFHARGARYQEVEELALRLQQFIDEEACLELLYQYREFWPRFTTSIATHREEMAKNASTAAMTAIKARQLACKDMSNTIGKMILRSKPSRQWGYPSFVNKVKKETPFIVFICFSLVLILGGYYSLKDRHGWTPSPLENCTTLTCAAPHGWMGPPGPQGAPPDFVITKGVGIIVSNPGIVGPPGHYQEKTGHWTVPGKCFSFQSGNKTKL